MFLYIDHRRPRTDQVYQQVRQSILAGRLRPGTRLPSSRALAKDLNLSRNTILRAYERLRLEGYIETQGSAGTTVVQNPPDSILWHDPLRDPAAAGPSPGRGNGGSPGMSTFAERVLKHPTIYGPLSGRLPGKLPFDFRFNLILGDRAAIRAWNQILRRRAAAQETDPILFDPKVYVGRLQEALCGYLRVTRGLRCTPEQLIVFTSGQQAIQMAARLMLDPGDAAVIEEPHYIGIRHTLWSLGVRVLRVPVDEAGMIVERLPREPRRIKLVYVVPSHQWPTGAVLSRERRRALISWAEANGAYILENDHNFEYRYAGRPIESLQGSDAGERVLYLGDQTRLFAPGLRIGYLVVPRSLVPVFSAAARLEDLFPSAFEQDVLAEFIAEGHLERLTRRICSRSRRAHEHLHAALQANLSAFMELHRPAAGFHILGRLHSHDCAQAERLVARAARRGVRFYPDTPYYVQPPPRPGLIFGIGSLSPDEIEEGVRRVAQVIREA